MRRARFKIRQFFIYKIYLIGSNVSNFENRPKGTKSLHPTVYSVHPTTSLLSLGWSTCCLKWWLIAVADVYADPESRFDPPWYWRKLNSWALGNGRQAAFSIGPENTELYLSHINVYIHTMHDLPIYVRII